MNRFNQTTALLMASILLFTLIGCVGILVSAAWAERDNQSDVIKENHPPSLQPAAASNDPLAERQSTENAPLESSNADTKKVVPAQESAVSDPNQPASRPDIRHGFWVDPLLLEKVSHIA